MALIHLYKRLTHRYRDGWKWQDGHEYVGVAKLLGGRETENRGIDGYTLINRMVAPSDLRGVDLTEAIQNTLSGSRCQHEYDCCGCAATMARVRRVSAREYVVRRQISYNI